MAFIAGEAVGARMFHMRARGRGTYRGNTVARPAGSRCVVSPFRRCIRTSGQRRAMAVNVAARHGPVCGDRGAAGAGGFIQRARAAVIEPGGIRAVKQIITERHFSVIMSGAGSHAVEMAGVAGKVSSRCRGMKEVAHVCRRLPMACSASNGFETVFVGMARNTIFARMMRQTRAVFFVIFGLGVAYFAHCLRRCAVRIGIGANAAQELDRAGDRRGETALLVGHRVADERSEHDRKGIARFYLHGPRDRQGIGVIAQDLDRIPRTVLPDLQSPSARSAIRSGAMVSRTIW